MHFIPLISVNMIVFELKVKSECEVTQLCPTLCDPVDCSLPRSSIDGIFQVRVLEWVAISLSRGSSSPRDRTQVSHFVGRCFTIWATREVFSWVHFSSVTQLCPTFCDPMDCSTPGLPVHHQPPEFTQTHVHWVDDAIQPSHSVVPFSHLQSFPASGSFPMSQFFTSGGQSIGVSASASDLPVNTQDCSLLGSLRTVCISLQSRDSQKSLPTPQFKNINSLVLSFLYSPTLTFIHDYWKNHSLD